MTKLCAVAAVAAMTLVLTASASAADGGVGSITGPISSSATGVCVLVLDASGQSVADAAGADATGRYTVDGVSAGAWTVEFVPDGGCVSQDTADGFQYYSNASTPAARADAMSPAESPDRFGSRSPPGNRSRWSYGCAAPAWHACGCRWASPAVARPRTLSSLCAGRA
jgi:hypothetical protein